MKAPENALIKRIVFFLIVASVCGCASPEEKAKENEGKKVAILHTVVIQQMKFTPADLTVNEGDTVLWINRDMVEHNITEEANKEWFSPSLAPGKSWSRVITKKAAYMCTIHPVMKGSLNVK